MSDDDTKQVELSEKKKKSRKRDIRVRDELVQTSWTFSDVMVLES